MIRIDYNQAIREAERLSNVSSDYQHCIILMEKLLKDVPISWRGEASEAFQLELRNWMNEAASIKNEANNLSRVVRTVAREIREAEKRAIAAMREE